MREEVDWGADELEAMEEAADARAARPASRPAAERQPHVLLTNDGKFIPAGFASYSEWESFATKRKEGEEWETGGRRYKRTGGKTVRIAKNAQQGPQDAPGGPKAEKSARGRPEGGTPPGGPDNAAGGVKEKAAKAGKEKTASALEKYLADPKAATPEDMEALEGAISGLKIHEARALVASLGSKFRAREKAKVQAEAQRLLAEVRRAGGGEGGVGRLAADPEVWKAFEAEFSRQDAASRGAGAKVPELVDAMVKSGLTKEQARAVLMRWRDDGKVALQRLNLRGAEPRAEEGIVDHDPARPEAGGGNLFYVQMRGEGGASPPKKAVSNDGTPGGGGTDRRTQYVANALDESVPLADRIRDAGNLDTEALDPLINDPKLSSILHHNEFLRTLSNPDVLRALGLRGPPPASARAAASDRANAAEVVERTIEKTKLLIPKLRKLAADGVTEVKNGSVDYNAVADAYEKQGLGLARQVLAKLTGGQPAPAASPPPAAPQPTRPAQAQRPMTDEEFARAEADNVNGDLDDAGRERFNAERTRRLMQQARAEYGAAAKKKVSNDGTFGAAKAEVKIQTSPGQGQEGGWERLMAVSGPDHGKNIAARTKAGKEIAAREVKSVPQDAQRAILSGVVDAAGKDPFRSPTVPELYEQAKRSHPSLTVEDFQTLIAQAHQRGELKAGAYSQSLDSLKSGQGLERASMAFPMDGEIKFYVRPGDRPKAPPPPKKKVGNDGTFGPAKAEAEAPSADRPAKQDAGQVAADVKALYGRIGGAVSPGRRRLNYEPPPQADVDAMLAKVESLPAAGVVEVLKAVGLPEGLKSKGKAGMVNAIRDTVQKMHNMVKRVNQ